MARTRRRRGCDYAQIAAECHCYTVAVRYYNLRHRSIATRSSSGHGAADRLRCGEGRFRYAVLEAHWRDALSRSARSEGGSAGRAGHLQTYFERPSCAPREASSERPAKCKAERKARRRTSDCPCDGGDTDDTAHRKRPVSTQHVHATRATYVGRSRWRRAERCGGGARRTTAGPTRLAFWRESAEVHGKCGRTRKRGLSRRSPQSTSGRSKMRVGLERLRPARTIQCEHATATALYSAQPVLRSVRSWRKRTDLV